MEEPSTAHSIDTPAHCALAYFFEDWPVFPVHSVVDGRCTCGRDDCTSPGKHPRTRNGLVDATNDPGQIQQWWRQWPDANVGIRTGTPGGIVVVDVDGTDGETSLRMFETQFGTLPTTRVSHTGKGRHLLFRTPDAKVVNRAGMLGPGLDIRGHGGYIVAPPSVHVTGARYTWEDWSHPIVEMPGWLLELTRASDPTPQGEIRPLKVAGEATPYGKAAMDAELERLMYATEGNRNDTLNLVAFRLGQLVSGGELSQSFVEEETTVIALSKGLGAPEVRKTLRSAMDAGMKFPRERSFTDRPLRVTSAPAIDPWEGTQTTPAPPEVAPNEAVTPTRRGLVDGETFVFEAPRSVPAVWGDGDQVAWASGESLLIVGPAGVGKTTIAQQLTLGLCGITPAVLGMPVAQGIGKVLYIAADRPRQAQRSFARMVTEDHREILRQKLVVWRGPLEKDLLQDPEQLLKLCEQTSAGAVVIDSLKDIALDLSKDETGGRVNRALQLVVAEGIEVSAIHHQRKSTGGATIKPKALDDVYGSAWIVNGAGSVILVWGEPGDPVVEISHLKQPAGDIGPFKVTHSHLQGRSEPTGRVDLFDLARAEPRGLTVRAAAAALFATSSPSPRQVEKARRRLDDIVSRGALVRIGGSKGGGEVRSPTRYHVAARDRDVSDVSHSHQPTTEQSSSILQSRPSTTDRGGETFPLRGFPPPVNEGDQTTTQTVAGWWSEEG